MAEFEQKKVLVSISKINPFIVVSILLLFNFLLRIFIWSNTELFRFADYAAYLGRVENLAKGEHQYLLEVISDFLLRISSEVWISFLFSIV
jgi:hypothetical protein